MDTLYATSWALTESTVVEAPPAAVYALVGDLTAMGQWSPECLEVTPLPGGRFRGRNRNAEGWEWFGDVEIVEARPPHTVCFGVVAITILVEGGPPPHPEHPVPDSTGETFPSPAEIATWRFTVEPHDRGCVLTQSHAVPEVPPFMRRFVERFPEHERAGVLAFREGFLAESMRTTLARVKAAAERAQP